MRILFLSTWFPYPYDNGSKLRVYHLLRALAKDHEVVLVSLAFDTANPDDPGDLQAYCHEIHAVRFNPFIENRAGTCRTFLSYKPVVANSIQTVREVVRDILRESQFDVIIASTIMMIEYALQSPAGTPLVFEDHNITSRLMWELYENSENRWQQLRRWLSWKKRRLYEARSFAKFDLVTMVSEQDREETLSVIGENGPPVEIIPNGVDCITHRPNLMEPRRNVLIFNGSLAYGANYEAMSWFVYKVFPIIKEKVPQISLIITGSKKGVDTSLFNSDSSILLTGFVDDVRFSVAEATVCVAPILAGGGTRLKILEAMALGTPVVSTTKGVEGIEALDKVHLLIADESSSFAESVVWLLEDGSMREVLAANGRRLVEDKYDWRPIGEQYTRLIEWVVQDKKKG